MNLNQVLSMIRAVLNLAGGSLAAKGYTDNSQWEAITGGVLALVSVVWSFYHHAEPAAPTTPPAAPK